MFLFQFCELLSGLTAGYELDGWDRDGLDSEKEADARYYVYVGMEISTGGRMSDQRKLRHDCEGY